MDEIEVISPPDQPIEVSPTVEIPTEIEVQPVYIEILQPPQVFIDLLVDPVVEEIEVISGVPIFITGGGGHGETVLGEVPTGAVNGTNKNFTTANDFITLAVYINGLRQRVGIDYSVTGVNSFSTSDAMLVGDGIQVDYTRL